VAFWRFGHGRGRWVRVSQRLHGYLQCISEAARFLAPYDSSNSPLNMSLNTKGQWYVRWHLIAQCPRKDAPGAACGVYHADLRERSD
jgi:hypothetical protein